MDFTMILQVGIIIIKLDLLDGSTCSDAEVTMRLGKDCYIHERHRRIVHNASVISIISIISVNFIIVNITFYNKVS